MSTNQLDIISPLRQALSASAKHVMLFLYPIASIRFCLLRNPSKNHGHNFASFAQESTALPLISLFARLKKASLNESLSYFVTRGAGRQPT